MSSRLLLPSPLLNRFREPMVLAALASIGLHGLLWVVLPLLPEPPQAQEADVQRPVELIELTPAEQSRLPDFSLPDLDLPPLTAPGSASGSATALPPLTGSTSPDFSLTPLPNQPPVGLPPLFVPPLPPPPPFFSSRPPAFDISPRTTPPPSPRVSPTSPPSPTPGGRSPSASPTPTTSPTPTASPAGSQTPAPPDADASPAPPALTAEERALITLNPELANQSQSVGLATFSTWFNEQARPWLGDQTTVEIPKREVNAGYPPLACQIPLGNNVVSVVVGVLVDADGKVVADPAPALLWPSGYPIFNQEAIAVAQRQTFEAGNKRAFQVTVNFRYDQDGCAAPATAPSPAASTPTAAGG